MTDDASNVTRRRFVAGAGAAVAAPMILTGRPWAMAQPAAAGGAEVEANDSIPIALIGAGIRGRNMLRNAYLRDDNFRVVAVCDVDTTRREHYQNFVNEHYGNDDCAAYINYEDVLARDDIAAVVNATPDHWHTNINIHAAMAGKDIYSEKPLTKSLREGQAVIEAVRKFDRVFQTGSQQRSEFGHRFVKACEYVRSGRLGQVISINIGVNQSPIWCDLPSEDIEPGLDWDRWLGPAPQRDYHSDLAPRGVHGHYPSWRAYREYCGGYLADMGAHHFDIAQWMLDADASGPVRVLPPQETESGFGAELVYDNGTRVIHGGDADLTVVGTGGIITVGRGHLESHPANILDTPLEEGDTHLPRNANHAKNWADCIRSREKPICDVEVGARTAAVCQLVNTAYWHGKPLAWDAENWRFVDDDEANEKYLDYDRREGYELPGF